jgi:hypothetical protein
MLPHDLQAHIAAACVTIRINDEDNFGRGVLVGGQLILTAAHTVIHAVDHRSPYPCAHALIGLSLGDHLRLHIETTHGTLYVRPYAIEPVTDIAVLGPLDNQVFFDETDAYDAWCEATAPVPLHWEALPSRTLIPAYIYTHRGAWLTGTVESGRDGAHGLRILFPEGIEGGTSGSPVVSDQGAILGIVSQAGGTEKDALDRGRDGIAPMPHRTLPPWLLQQMRIVEA